MAKSGASGRRRHHPRRRSWCCSFAVRPGSPENLDSSRPKTPNKPSPSLPPPPTKHPASSLPNSPLSSKSGLSYRRRILSPGRVSPIDSESNAVDPVQEIGPDPSPPADAAAPSKSESSRVSLDELRPPPPEACSSSSSLAIAAASSPNGGENGAAVFDVRLNLKGKNGGCLVLELNSEPLCANSAVFANLISEYRKGSTGAAAKMCRIEVPDVENLSVLRQTIELMFEEDITKQLLKIGVYRSIDVLEASASIMFAKGVICCLKYLEAVPWNEEEEDKLRSVFARFKFDDARAADILARIHSSDYKDSQQSLARELVWAITGGANAYARNELKSLVKGLLCQSSVYVKEQPDLNKQDLYVVCECCMGSLVNLFEEASNTTTTASSTMKADGKPLVERISRQVDNISWLLEILLDQQIAEEFVDMWADQSALIRMHKNSSPMVRYDVSRVSAILFTAIGTRQVHCRSEARTALFQSWFGPMLLDFGWLQRCRKGLNTKALEEAIGRALLTLPLKQQHFLFMEWFRCFSKNGTECPNLSKAFQIWWRRSSPRASETYRTEYSPLNAILEHDLPLSDGRFGFQE